MKTRHLADTETEFYSLAVTKTKAAIVVILDQIKVGRSAEAQRTALYLDKPVQRQAAFIVIPFKAAHQIQMDALLRQPQRHDARLGFLATGIAVDNVQPEIVIQSIADLLKNVVIHIRRQQRLIGADHPDLSEPLLLQRDLARILQIAARLPEVTVHGRHQPGRQQVSQVLLRQRQQQGLLLTHARQRQPLGFDFPAITIGFAPVVALHIKMLGNLSQVPLDAAQVALITRRSQLPLQLRRSDLAVPGNAAQQLDGQMHRFHTVTVFGHGLPAGCVFNG